MKSKILFAAVLALPIVGYTDQNQNFPAPPAGFDVSQNGIPHGTVTASVSYPTRNVGNRLFTIYLPPGYSAATRYPVLYLLHGIGGNQLSWIGQGSNEGTAQHVMDALYSRNLARPMIVVMPYGNMVNTTGDTWQNFEDVLINDLAPYIQNNYSAATDAQNRALAGLSMGGGQTLNFGPKNSTFFNWVGAFSPAPNSQGTATNFANMTTIRANLRFLWLSCGTLETSYLTRCNQYHDYSMTNNLPQHMLNIEQNLNHEKLNWNRSLYNFAQRIFASNTGVNGPGRAGVDAKSQRSRLLVRSGNLVVQHLDATGRWESRLFTLDGKAIPAKDGIARASSAPQP